MTCDILLIGTDQTILLTGLRDTITGSYVNGATVTVTVKNASTEANVSGQSWPSTMAYVAASNGNYRGTLEDGMALEDGVQYSVEVTADAGSDVIHFWRELRYAQYDIF